ncbi:unnamed protein product, partial [Mesorhabditis spiculigera]
MDSGPVQADFLSDAECSVYSPGKSTITVSLDSVYEVLPSEVMVSMEAISKGIFDEPVDCSFYDPPRSETNVSMLESLDPDMETALDSSIYEALPSEAAVSMENFSPPAARPCASVSSVLTAWEHSDPSVYSPKQNTCNVEFDDISIESDHSDWSEYEMPPSVVLVEMEPVASSSVAEVVMRGNLTPQSVNIRTTDPDQIGLYVNKA